MEKEIYKLYNGEIELCFDKNQHLYTVNGKRVLGVTNIVNVISKPALIYWAVNSAIDYIDANLQVGQPIDEVQKRELLKVARVAHTVHKTKAADIGTMIHDFCEKYVKAKIANAPLPKMPINEKMRNSIEAFLKWEKEHNVKFLISEQKIYSRKYEYAGTMDIEAEVDGELSVVDLKTSSGIYPEMVFQVAAYLKAREEETGKDYKAGWIVRIGKDGELVTHKFTDCEDDFKAFLGALMIYQRQMALKDAIYQARSLKV